MAGFNTAGLDTAGKNLVGIDFSNINLTIEQLTATELFYYTKLSGTGITQEDLEALGYGYFHLYTITF